MARTPAEKVPDLAGGAAAAGWLMLPATAAYMTKPGKSSAFGGEIPNCPPLRILLQLFPSLEMKPSKFLMKK